MISVLPMDEATAAIIIFLLSQVFYNIRKISSLEVRLAKIEDRLKQIEKYLRFYNNCEER